MKISGNKKGVVGEVTGFLGILNNIDSFGEGKRVNKKGKHEGKKIRSCSSDHESKASCKKGGKKLRTRKVSVSKCSDDSHSEHNSDNKRRGGKSSDCENFSDSGSESSCSKKSEDKGRRRKLVESNAHNGKKNSPKILT